MPKLPEQSHEQEVTSDLWIRELSHIPTAYGRLVYLAGLRDPNTGRYEHYGATRNSSSWEANQALKRIHETAFKEWVSFGLEQKKEDIEFYIAGIEQVDRAELIDAWLRLTPYKNLVPGSIQGP